MDKEKIEEALNLLATCEFDIGNLDKLLRESLEEKESEFKAGDWVEVRTDGFEWVLTNFVDYTERSTDGPFVTRAIEGRTTWGCCRLPQRTGILIRHNGGPKPEWIDNKTRVSALEGGVFVTKWAVVYEPLATRLNWSEVSLYMVWPDV